MKGVKPMTAASPSPHQTGQADFPHPAFARCPRTELSQADQSEALSEVRIERLALRRAPRPLAATPQMARQSADDVVIDLAEAFARIAVRVIIGPTAQVRVELTN